MATMTDTQTCAVCRRHFLPGESVQLFRDRAASTLQRVCPLCRDGARRRGWELVEATRENPLRTPADPERLNATVRRDLLVERLQEQLDETNEQLERVRGSLHASEQRGAALDAVRVELRESVAQAARTSDMLADALRERDRALAEVDRLNAALEAAERHEARRERAERRARELEEEVAAITNDRDRILRARRREADHTYLRGIAAEAFNRSEHADAVAGFARTWGPPRVRVAVEGIGLPRQVRLLFAWERGWSEYRVGLDLAARTATVDEHAAGDDPRQGPPANLQENASWAPSSGVIVA